VFQDLAAKTFPFGARHSRVCERARAKTFAVFLSAAPAAPLFLVPPLPFPPLNPHRSARNTHTEKTQKKTKKWRERMSFFG